MPSLRSNGFIFRAAFHEAGSSLGGVETLTASILASQGRISRLVIGRLVLFSVSQHLQARCRRSARHPCTMFSSYTASLNHLEGIPEIGFHAASILCHTDKRRLWRCDCRTCARQPPRSHHDHPVKRMSHSCRVDEAVAICGHRCRSTPMHEHQLQAKRKPTIVRQQTHRLDR
jgi:hypothetical protein